MKKYLFLSLVLLLTSCIGGTSKMSSFYTLIPNTSNDIKFGGTKNFVVGVDIVSVPTYIDRPQIVTLGESDMDLVISETNRWAEPLSNSVQRVMVNNLAGLTSATIRPLNSNRGNFKYIIAIEINSMDARFNDKAIFDAWWYIKNTSGKAIVSKHNRFEVPIGNTYNNMVEAQSKMLNDLAKDIAKIISIL